MTQEYKELLFKDLSARLPHHVRVKVWLKDGTTEEGILDLEHNYGDVLRDAFYYNKIVDIKPYLRPFSSMTEEENNERKQLGILYAINDNHERIFDGFGNESVETQLKAFDWLNRKMFAYRTIDGKDMFELGIALQAPEGMY